MSLLTKTERTILAAAAEGESAQETADRLFLSRRTVDFHRQNIYRKYGVDNIVRAIRRGIAEGDIPPIL